MRERTCEIEISTKVKAQWAERFCGKGFESGVFCGYVFLRGGWRHVLQKTNSTF